MGLIIFWIINSAVTGYIAYKKERNILIWAIVGFMLPILSVIMILSLARKGQKFSVGNIIGLCLILFLFLGMPALFLVKAIIWQRTDGVKIIKALESYKSKAGVYPEQIEELVPAYIDRLPTKRQLFYTRGYEFSFEGAKERDNPQKYSMSYFWYPAVPARCTYIPSQNNWVYWD